jgi:hypothetical protein
MRSFPSFLPTLPPPPLPPLLPLSFLHPLKASISNRAKMDKRTTKVRCLLMTGFMISSPVNFILKKKREVCGTRKLKIIFLKL